MKFTKMNVTGQLDARGAARFAARVGAAYIIAAVAGAFGGLVALIWAVRWW
ncbi:hypothetical protein [Burkholderia sp. Bp9031]|uniref:hypothetical protein n=1 Tax=Burkholderia sp. Bp9031 TaxID=2184566 RepID=UPI00163A8608|nr:hypothetical protein [Burkholderia sp. Bp9031]